VKIKQLIILLFVFVSIVGCIDQTGTSSNIQNTELSNVMEAPTDEDATVDVDAVEVTMDDIVGADAILEEGSTNLPVTIAKESEGESGSSSYLYATGISFRTGSESGSLFYSSALADYTGTSVYMLGEEGTSTPGTQFVLTNSQDEQIEFMSKEDGGFRVKLKADFIDDELKLIPNGADQDYALGLRVDKTAKFFSVTISGEDPGIRHRASAIYDDYVFYNAYIDGESRIMVRDLKGGHARVFGVADTVLKQMYYVPTIKINNKTVPPKILGVDENMNLVKILSNGTLEYLNDTKLGETTPSGIEYNVSEVFHSPKRNGTVSIMYGVNNDKSSSNVTPFFIVPSKETASDLVMITPLITDVFARSFGWVTNNKLLSLSQLTPSHDAKGMTKYVADDLKATQEVVNDLRETVAEANDEEANLIDVNQLAHQGKPAPLVPVVNMSGEEVSKEVIQDEESTVVEVIDLHSVFKNFNNDEEYEAYANEINYVATAKNEVLFVTPYNLNNLVTMPITAMRTSQPYFLFNYKDEDGVNQVGLSNYLRMSSLETNNGNEQNKGKPTISKDGTFIAYSVEHSDGSSDIKIHHLPSNTRFFLTTKHGEVFKNKRNVNVQFARNSKYVLTYYTVDEHDNAKINIVNMYKHPVAAPLIRDHDESDTDFVNDYFGKGKYLLQKSLDREKPKDPGNLIKAILKTHGRHKSLYR